jgi:hypothetical protein
MALIIPVSPGQRRGQISHCWYHGANYNNGQIGIDA